MAGLRPLINGIALTLLFTLCLFSFMAQYLLLNNPSSPVLSNPAINQSINQLNTTITNFQNSAGNAQVTLAGDQPTATEFLFLIFKSAFYIPMSFLSMIVSSISLFTQFIFTQIVGPGSNPFFLAFAVFNGIMVIAAVFLIIAHIRTGQSER